MSRLTVIMPVYNAEKFLSMALESMLNQTFGDFVLFVIDDGSTDCSSEIINQYRQKDSRIVFYSQENQGLIATLNHYFGMVTTEYVARMDADDISMPHRFEKQLRYLDKNRDIGAVGTGITLMNADLSRVLSESSFPDSHAKIVWKMLYTTGVPHAPVMLRKEIFDNVGGYSPHAKYVEDYDFFLRAKRFAKFANLQETLYIYRQNEDSVSQKYFMEQKDNHFRLSKEEVTSLLPNASDDLISFLKYHTLSEGTDSANLYSMLKHLYINFLSRNDVTREEMVFIKKDLIRKLKILSLTSKNHSLWKGITLYLRTLINEITSA